jgi:hypothetical protein
MRALDSDRVRRLKPAACVVKVRLFPWVQDPYLEEVVHQEAAEVDWEGTNRSKALGVKGLFQQFSESAGQNASELSSRPRKRELWKPTHHRHGEGRCRPSRAQPGLVGSTGVMTLARDKGNDHATREDRRGGRVLGGQTGGSREIDRATAGVGQAHSTVEAG